MLKNTVFVLSSFLMMTFFQSCKDYKKTENGLRYKILADSAGKNAQVDGFIVFNFLYKNDKDSILANTFKDGRPVSMPIQKASFKGGIEEGFTLLSQGDSAEFLVNADSLYTKTFGKELPKEVKSGSDIKFIIKVVKVYTKDEVAKEQEKMMKERETQQKAVFEQLAKDTVTIVDFLKSKNIKAKKTENGVYYVVTKPGDGNLLQKGDTAKIFYSGRLLNGQEFDSNIGKEAFLVPLGAGQVIYGWEEGLSKLKGGDKATFYIPSPLGYGPQDMGKIPANSILVFDIEVLK
ncbi:MAG TPA: FKBP-type peptidyl-prolyl cis-trans isomerase [Cytophagaceae bacterium]